MSRASNFPPEEYERLLSQGRLGRCNGSGVVFDIGRVETLDRYADCTGFRCPGCKQRHDDRHSWDGDPDGRMGYRVVRVRTSRQPVGPYGRRLWA